MEFSGVILCKEYKSINTENCQNERLIDISFKVIKTYF